MPLGVGGDHSSGPPIARRLDAAYPRVLARTPKRPARVTGRAGPPLLFGLAPRGVYPAADITGRAVGSYPTVSPLPSATIGKDLPEVWPPADHRFARRRFIFCGTVRNLAPASRTPGPLALPGALPCGVRTFLQPIPLQESASDRPARSLEAIIAHRVVHSAHCQSQAARGSQETTPASTILAKRLDGRN